MLINDHEQEMECCVRQLFPASEIITVSAKVRMGERPTHAVSIEDWANESIGQR